ncbi:MAG: hypothetical protein JWQ18_1154 [Conexibacter sp.]|nr:hypothetical protein [Conexibacter sp.]
MEHNLRLLHDVLARTPIAGRLWLFGGLLLGAIREGEIMLHDSKDADFGFLAEDEPRLLASFGALVDAGFAPHLRFPAATGPATEYSFLKDGAKYEFFKVTVDGERFTWTNHGYRDDVPTQNTCAIPAQPLDELRFLDRTWLKVRDVDLDLTALYGDWRTPAPGFPYMEAPTIVARAPWDDATYGTWAEVYGTDAPPC